MWELNVKQTINKPKATNLIYKNVFFYEKSFTMISCTEGCQFILCRLKKNSLALICFSNISIGQCVKRFSAMK